MFLKVDMSSQIQTLTIPVRFLPSLHYEDNVEIDFLYRIFVELQVLLYKQYNEED